MDAITTRADRAKAISQANANAKIEGFEPDDSDRESQQQFIEGTLSLEDLLEIARNKALAPEAGES
jgi:triphosphoribosyl-dephospho-CoA synthetase